ncbi:MAG TPA: LytTR family DNA-binding domain-containing protein [Allosphingosinicella sp.]|nr:LytTR family DNA-binding domain-containing protein [Allosphingosinicella sp.]
MASKLAFPADRARPAAGKATFANRVRRFANAVSRLPGFPLLWISSAAAAVLAIVTGAFNTGQIPLGQRSLFWMLVLGWNLVKWQTWFAFTVRKPSDWTRASLAGFLLNLTLPLETLAAIRIVGLDATTGALGTWLYALVISIVLFAVIWAAKSRMGFVRQVPIPAGIATVAQDGLLARAGVAQDALVAIQAEDHYCRVHRRDGSSALIHYRFADALMEVAKLGGQQVHRGAWVAASACCGAVRDGRRWRLRLSDGRLVAVSASYLAAVRSRGWLRRNSSTISASVPQSAVALGGARP